MFAPAATPSAHRAQLLVWRPDDGLPCIVSLLTLCVVQHALSQHSNCRNELAWVLGWGRSSGGDSWSACNAASCSAAAPTSAATHVTCAQDSTQPNGLLGTWALCLRVWIRSLSSLWGFFGGSGGGVCS